MSTQIQVSPKSGITIGTTPITSGVAGRVLFQGSGNVMQEDSSLFWDNTNKRLGIGATPAINVRLDIRAQGLLSTDIALRVRNSADTRDIININGDSSIGIGTPIISPSSGFVFKQIAGGSEIKGYDGWNGQSMSFNTYLGVFTARSDLRIGSESGNGYLGLITTTSQNRFLKLIDGFGNEYLSLGGNGYDGGGGISLTLKTTTTNNSNFVTFSRSNNTNPFVISDQAFTGIGTATPQARLDIRAQGALSTDFVIRARNSADTANLLSLQSDGVFRVGEAFTDFITLKTSFFNNAPSYISIKKYANDFTYLGTDKSWSYGFLGLGHTSPLYYIDAIGGNRYENAARIGTNYNPFATAGQETSTSFLFTTGKQGGTWGGDPAVKLTAYTYLSTVDRSTFIIGMNKGGVNTQRAAITSQSNLLLQAPIEDINDIGVIYIPNGTAPTSSITDGVKQYSADITAGNAAPHFRTENGSVIKLYKQDLPTNPTNAEIATFLSNLGLANLI